MASANVGKCISVPKDEKFLEYMNEAGDKLVVVDFFATWFYSICNLVMSFFFRCGPCRAIAPFLEQMAAKYSSAVFLKVDVDVCQVYTHKQ